MTEISIFDRLDHRASGPTDRQARELTARRGLFMGADFIGDTDTRSTGGIRLAKRLVVTRQLAFDGK